MIIFRSILLTAEPPWSLLQWVWEGVCYWISVIEPVCPWGVSLVNGYSVLYLGWEKLRGNEKCRSSYVFLLRQGILNNKELCIIDSLYLYFAIFLHSIGMNSLIQGHSNLNIRLMMVVLNFLSFTLFLD